MFGGGHAGVVVAQELDGALVAVSGVLNLCEACAAVVANVVGALVGNLGHALATALESCTTSRVTAWASAITTPRAFGLANDGRHRPGNGRCRKQQTATATANYHAETDKQPGVRLTECLYRLRMTAAHAI